MQTVDRDLEAGGCIDGLREARHAPEDDAESENDPRKSGAEDDFAAVAADGTGFAGYVFAGGVEDSLWLPDTEEGYESGHADDRGGDISQPGAVEGRDQKEGCAVGGSGDEDGRPDLEHGTESSEGPDEPERNEHAKGREHSADDACEKEGVESGHAVKCDDGGSDGSEGDWRSVCEQPKARSLERRKAEADKDGCTDGDGSSEACCALEECSEGKGDQEKLQAAVGCYAHEAVLELCESAGANGELIEEKDWDDDPADGKEAVGGAESGCKQREA